MDNQGKKDGRLILAGLVGVILLVIIGVVAGILIGVHASRPAAGAAAPTTVSAAPKKAIDPEYAWHGMDVRKSGTGVYPGMDKERACTQAGVEAAWWLINGTEPDRTKQIFQRFYLGGDTVAKGSTAHWINHAAPPYTAVAKDLYMTGSVTVDENSVDCVVSIDGRRHPATDAHLTVDDIPAPGVLDLQLTRKDKDSGWYVIGVSYNQDNYEIDIKQQGDD